MDRRESASSSGTAFGTKVPFVFGFDGWRLDLRRRLLTSPTNETVSISSTAYAVLVLLVRRAGELVTRTELMHAVWPTTIVEENNLNQAVASLRRALGEGYIATVTGKGYQFVVPVAVLIDTERSGALSSVTGTGATALRATSPSTPDLRIAPADLPAPQVTDSWFRSKAAVATLATLAVCVVGAILYLMRPAPFGAHSTHLGRVSHVSPITTFPGEANTPSFAPDGTRIAFSWARDGAEPDIYVMQVGIGEPLRLTQGGGVNRDPAWSPDGMQIAFLRQHDPENLDLMLVPALGGTARKLQSVRMYFVSRDGSPRLAWTPDSRQLLFTTQRQPPNSGRAYELHVLSLDTGRARPLEIVQQDIDYDTSPALTGDSRRLAFVRYRIGQRLGQVMVQDLGPDLKPVGSPRQLPGVESGVPHSLFWSRDGRFLRFLVGGDILEWDAEQGVRTVQTIGTTSIKVGAMALVSNASGDRAAITQIRTDEDIWAVPLDPVTHVATGSPVARVVSTSFERHPRFSPDGRSLAFISGRSGAAAVWVADADGSHLRQLSNLQEQVTGFPRWSPDGQRIAFHTSAQDQERMVYVVDVAGGTPTKLGGGCCPGGWSADGRFIYVGDFGSVTRVARLAVPLGKRESLFEGISATETPDGRLLVYAKDGKPGLFARSLQGDVTRNPERKLLDDFVVGPLVAYIPMNGGIYYLGFTPEGRPRAFRYYDFANGTTHDVMPAPRGLSLGLTVSPDERELLYAADQPDAGSDITLFEFAKQ
jgi:Tol biopolymer transport system component/DNA-binding winged helix-turn-helix (wHTH) protein